VFKKRREKKYIGKRGKGKNKGVLKINAETRFLFFFLFLKIALTNSNYRKPRHPNQ
jgi:hypothetical protein